MKYERTNFDMALFTRMVSAGQRAAQAQKDFLNGPKGRKIKKLFEQLAEMAGAKFDPYNLAFSFETRDQFSPYMYMLEDALMKAGIKKSERCCSSHEIHEEDTREIRPVYRKPSEPFGKWPLGSKVEEMVTIPGRKLYEEFHATIYIQEPPQATGLETKLQAAVTALGEKAPETLRRTSGSGKAR